MQVVRNIVRTRHKILKKIKQIEERKNFENIDGTGNDIELVIFGMPNEIQKRYP